MKKGNKKVTVPVRRPENSQPRQRVSWKHTELEKIFLTASIANTMDEAILEWRHSHLEFTGSRKIPCDFCRYPLTQHVAIMNVHKDNGGNMLRIGIACHNKLLQYPQLGRIAVSKMEKLLAEKPEFFQKGVFRRELHFNPRRKQMEEQWLFNRNGHRYILEDRYGWSAAITAPAHVFMTRTFGQKRNLHRVWPLEMEPPAWKPAEGFEYLRFDPNDVDWWGWDEYFDNAYHKQD